MKYSCVPIETGFAVAFASVSGQLVAVEEHYTRQSAEREAARLNAGTPAPKPVRDAGICYAPRRSVRYFEDDAFA